MNANMKCLLIEFLPLPIYHWTLKDLYFHPSPEGILISTTLVRFMMIMIIIFFMFISQPGISDANVLFITSTIRKLN